MPISPHPILLRQWHSCCRNARCEWRGIRKCVLRHTRCTLEHGIPKNGMSGMQSMVCHKTSVAQLVKHDRMLSIALVAAGRDALCMLMQVARMQPDSGPKTLRAFVHAHWQYRFTTCGGVECVAIHGYHVISTCWPSSLQPSAPIVCLFGGCGFLAVSYLRTIYYERSVQWNKKIQPPKSGPSGLPL